VAFSSGINLVIEDEANDPTTALRKMTTWFGEGVKFFAGPQNSGSSREMLAFANANEILFVSQSATAPALAIPGDFLHHFVAADDVQGPVIAAVIQEAGIKHVIFTFRGDTWGDGLHTATTASIEALGGIEILEKELRYDPALEAFSVQAALLDDYVTELVEAGAALEEIGIVALTFEEIAPFMEAASEYPQLRQVKWFGSDGNAKTHPTVESQVAVPFAFDTRFIAPAIRVDLEAPSYIHVKNQIQAELGRVTDVYALKAYDVIWALAMAIDEAGYDSVKVRAILPRVAEEWSSVYGASGKVVLNEAGDRAFADYDYWLINEELEWEAVGYFDYETKELIWIREIY